MRYFFDERCHHFHNSPHRSNLVVKMAQEDIVALLKILNKSTKKPAAATLLTNLLTYLTQVNTITQKIDTPLKIITGASTTTDKDGLANLFANYFSLKATEELTQSGAALLQAGGKVMTDNYNAYKALGLPANPTEADLDKIVKATISAAIKGNLSVSDLDAFTTAAQAHQSNLDKWLNMLDDSDASAKKLKAALTLPAKYAETFRNLENFIKKASSV